jgi:hypothetical protein
MSHQALERDPLHLPIHRPRNSESPATDFTATRPEINDSFASDSLPNPIAQPAASAPRDWDKLTSNGFLGWKSWFNYKGIRDIRAKEKAARQAAFDETFSRGLDSDFTDSSGILSSRFGLDQLKAKEKSLPGRLNRVAAAKGEKRKELGSAYIDDQRRAERLRAFVMQSEAAAKRGSSVTSAPQPVMGPTRPALRSAMKRGVRALPERQRDASDDAESAQVAAESAAYESFKSAQASDTSMALDGLDASMESGMPQMTGKDGDYIPTQLWSYMSTMSKSAQAAEQRRRAAADRIHADQGDLAMPKSKFPLPTAGQAVMYSGFWGREQANPAPTRKAGHDRHVGFADTEPGPGERPGDEYFTRQGNTRQARQPSAAVLAATQKLGADLHAKLHGSSPTTLPSELDE